MREPGAPTGEQLAAATHDIWSHWMRYYLSVDIDGVRVWETVDYGRWRRQCVTPYEELSEKEKASDREVADKHLKPLTCRASQWVSVEERLPEGGLFVLLCYFGTLVDVACRDWDSDDKKDEWYWVLDSIVVKRDEATHWMPLPELPEVDDD